MSLKKLAKFSIVSVAVAVAAGCASFKGNEVAVVDKLPDVSQYQNKPSVYVDLNFYRGNPGQPGVEMAPARARVQEVMEEQLVQSKLFSSYTFDPSKKASAAYTIQVKVHNHGNEFLATVAGAITGATMGVIPCAATDNYTVEMTALDNSDGKVIKTVSTKDSITTWMGLIFIPMMGHTPNEAFRDTVKNQIRAGFKELLDSGAMKYSMSTPRWIELGA